MKPFLERLKYLIDAHYDNIPHFAKVIGTKPDSLRSYFTKDSIPGKVLREKFSHIGINNQWLDYGEGEMFLNNNSGHEVKFIRQLNDKFTSEEILQNLFDSKQISQKWSDEMAHEFIIKLKPILPYIIQKAKMYSEINGLEDIKIHLNELQKILK